MAKRKRAVFEATTLNDLLNQGLSLWAWCPKCPRSQRIDARALAYWYGRGTKLGKIEGALVCSVCRSKQCELHVDWSAHQPKLD